MTLFARMNGSGFPAGRSLVVLGLGLLLGGVVPCGARAQTSLMPGGSSGVGSVPGTRHIGAGGDEKPPVPAPDAIPGARARTPAAPASKTVGDMAPNDALFDAINRGDIASARDALNRGADLRAVNILGMTPMELSVDLGRNDISFLLLSMRGEGGSERPPVAVAKAAPAKKPEVAVKTASAARQATAVKPVSVAQKPVQAPKLFANDGGTPRPDAGFLGFDPHSATN